MIMAEKQQNSICETLTKQEHPTTTNHIGEKETGMRTTREKLTRICRNTLTALAVLVAIGGATSALAGAIFTTDLNCEKVNGNIYAAKTDVWLNGGPDGNGSALKPGTTYCILVSAPGGTRALNTIECRKTTDS